MRKLFLVIAATAVLGGCATTPAVTYQYYPVKSLTTFVVNQTIDCNAAKTEMFTVNVPQATTAYSADTSQPVYSVTLSSLDGPFADTDVGAKFSEDGMLQSINQSSTGQGEAILKSAISLAASVAAIGGGAPAKGAATLPECTALATWGGGKPVALTYTLPANLLKVQGYQVLNGYANDKGLYALLQSQLPTLSVTMGAPVVLSSGARYKDTASRSDIVMLTLQQVESVPVEFDANGSAISTTNIVVPTLSTYTLPIPTAALFGSDKLTLSLGASGAITGIEYAKTTGAANAFNVLGAAASAATPESTAGKAAEVKAQADLIAQQQRLVRCQAQPAQCQ
jgi:hypothetical protein